MKILALKLSLVAFVVGAIVLPFSSVKAADECSKELLLEYFPKQFVTETLKKFNVPQDKWDAIATSLSSKDKDVVKLVEEKASKLNPNPLKDRDPQQRQVAVKLFRETLLQVFSDALQANGISDSKELQAMLDDIQQQKARNFAQCMEKQKAAVQPQQTEEKSKADTEQQPETDQQPAAAPEARLEGDDDSDLIVDNDQQMKSKANGTKADSDDEDNEDKEDEEDKEKA